MVESTLLLVWLVYGRICEWASRFSKDELEWESSYRQYEPLRGLGLNRKQPSWWIWNDEGTNTTSVLQEGSTRWSLLSPPPVLWSNFRADVTCWFMAARRGTRTFVGMNDNGGWAGIWNVIGTAELSIEIHTQNNIEIQENWTVQKIHHFHQISSLSNLLLLSASFLELVGSKVCSRQAWASAGTYLYQEVNPTCCKEKEDKEAPCYIHIVVCSSPTMKSRTLASTCIHYQLGNEYTGIFRWKKKKIATEEPIWADTEETTGNLYSY